MARQRARTKACAIRADRRLLHVPFDNSMLAARAHHLSIARRNGNLSRLTFGVGLMQQRTQHGILFLMSLACLMVLLHLTKVIGQSSPSALEARAMTMQGGQWAQLTGVGGLVGAAAPGGPALLNVTDGADGNI